QFRFRYNYAWRVGVETHLLTTATICQNRRKEEYLIEIIKNNGNANEYAEHLQTCYSSCFKKLFTDRYKEKRVVATKGTNNLPR
uniref:Uncharacterized protein n=1 Tax=Parascaris equorum TaxID=6256 RepID=A0A914RPS4_PAREQ